MGEKHTQTVQGRDSSPPPGRRVLVRQKQQRVGRWGTQAAAMKVTHGVADTGSSHGGGRADDSRGVTDGSGAGGGGARRGDGEPMSQGDRKDPEGRD